MAAVIFLCNDTYMISNGVDGIVVELDDLPDMLLQFKRLLKKSQWKELIDATKKQSNDSV